MVKRHKLGSILFEDKLSRDHAMGKVNAYILKYNICLDDSLKKELERFPYNDLTKVMEWHGDHLDIVNYWHGKIESLIIYKDGSYSMTFGVGFF